MHAEAILAQEIQKMCEILERIADAQEQQNKMLNDIIQYPADVRRPPRVLVDITEPVEIIKD